MIYHNQTSHRFYGHMCASCGSFTVSIDGLTPQRLNSMGSHPYYLVQRMVWSNTSLDPGRHTLNVTNDEDNGSGVYLDFFRQVIDGVKDKGQTSDSPSLPSLSPMLVQCPPRGKHIYPPPILFNHEPWRVTNDCTSSPSHQPKSNKQGPASRRFDTRSSCACSRPLRCSPHIPSKRKKADGRTLRFSIHWPSDQTIRPAIEHTASSKGRSSTRSTTWRPYGHGRPVYVSERN